MRRWVGGAPKFDFHRESALSSFPTDRQHTINFAPPRRFSTKTPAETPGFVAILFNQSPDLPDPPGAAEPIVYAGFENVKFIVGQETVTAEVHHVVLKLRSPVVPQGIFGSEAEHPSTDSLVYRP